MNEKSVGLNILFWSETIIALRVMLFTIPVILNKSMAGEFVLANQDDRFIAVLTGAAIIYLIVGIASVFGYRYWKAAHYLAAVFTLILTGASLVIVKGATAGVGMYYFTPVVFAAVLSVMTGALGKTR